MSDEESLQMRVMARQIKRFNEKYEDIDDQIETLIAKQSELNQKCEDMAIDLMTAINRAEAAEAALDRVRSITVEDIVKCFNFNEVIIGSLSAQQRARVKIWNMDSVNEIHRLLTERMEGE